jgi:hypothetical protein
MIFKTLKRKKYVFASAVGKNDANKVEFCFQKKLMTDMKLPLCEIYYVISKV